MENDNEIAIPEVQQQNVAMENNDVSFKDDHQAFDRFSLLPYNVKHKIISMLDKKSLLTISSVCWELNEIASPLITKNFMLVIEFSCKQSFCRGQAISDMFTTMLRNSSKEGRQYTKCVFTEVEWATSERFRSLVFYALSVIGHSVKDLSIWSSVLCYFDGVELLGCFNSVTRLEFKHVNINPSSETMSASILPQLKELIIECSSPWILNWFLLCRGLERFEFEMDLLKYIDFPFEYDTQTFEDFLIAQDNLKHLVLSYLLRLDMFKEDRSGATKFRLESITLLETYFQNTGNTLKFFETQKNSIKSFEIWIEESDPRLLNYYKDIMKLMYSSPALIKITTNIGITDSREFSTNPSIKCVEFSEHVDSNMILNMTKVFPKIDNVCTNSPILILHDYKCEDLRLIKCNAPLNTFKYQPTINIDRPTFEIMVKCFLLRNNKIRVLSIGNNSWIQNNFGLSLRFCMDLCKILPHLTRLELWNPMQIQNVVMFLLCTRKRFDSITLYTNEAGNAKVKRMRKKGLKIIVF